MASIIKGLSSKEKDSIMIILTEDDPDVGNFIKELKNGETYYLELHEIRDTDKQMATHVEVYEV